MGMSPCPIFMIPFFLIPFSSLLSCLLFRISGFVHPWIYSLFVQFLSGMVECGICMID
ncbi:uncharacterized protein BDW47DRAFT_111368 [Aspergillus candidus]|uniref:Uncharacterized protein n=1 Tax=Aspergillus candidus TaxID=41067 RepID=A0A2I2F2L3_ASPCN|nr:hypothetical protein BDW47DRAFT_111368 [Aspergillus candidus]PLB34848.1 hypothetical protein BDW47DRAFT_111368 [Aspergillus candidus]